MNTFLNTLWVTFINAPISSGIITLCVDKGFIIENVNEQFLLCDNDTETPLAIARAPAFCVAFIKTFMFYRFPMFT